MDVRTAGLRLRDALNRRDVAEVRAILSAEPEAANWQDDEGCAALHVAGRTDLIKVLLDAGANINLADRSGFTPLHLLAISGGRKATQLLLARGARLDTVDSDGCTPLHAAAAFLREDHVEQLLANGADPGARNKQGYPPAHYALLDGNERTARFLWERTGVRDVFLAAGLGEVGYLADLLQKDPAQAEASDARSLTPLHWAAMCGRPESASVLLRRTRKVDARDEVGRTPLHWSATGYPTTERAAVGARSFEVAKLLVDHGAEISARSNDGKTPLELLLSYSPAAKPALAKLLGAQNEP